MKESDIVYEKGKFWVKRVARPGKHDDYDVYETMLTHSVRRDGFSLATAEESLRRAIARCDQRAEAAK